MKVTFEYTETTWFKRPFTLEISQEDLPGINLEDKEDCKQEIEDFIYSNYSIEDLIKMGAYTDGNTELIVTEINGEEV